MAHPGEPALDGSVGLPPPVLSCPVCGGTLEATERALGCEAGHRYLTARQGYFNLLTGRKSPLREDTADMVAARFEVLEAGLYDALSDRLAALAHAQLQAREAPVVLDGGTGTGHYLKAVLQRLPRAFGVGLDRSRYALRRAAKVERSVALAWDLRRRWPVHDASVDLVLDVFAPRNPPELARVLRATGRALVVTPADGHLKGLEGLGLLTPHPGKAEAVREAFGAVGLRVLEEEVVRDRRRVETALAAAIVGMGPAGHHHSPEAIRARVDAAFRTGTTEEATSGAREVQLAFRIQVLGRA